jgi:hypothetical protein
MALSNGALKKQFVIREREKMAQFDTSISANDTDPNGNSGNLGPNMCCRLSFFSAENPEEK